MADVLLDDLLPLFKAFLPRELGYRRLSPSLGLVQPSITRASSVLM